MTRSERLAHARDEARACIPGDLLCVWDRVYRTIRATERMSLAEAFEQWCHDHGALVIRLQCEHAERGARALDRAQRREARERDLARFVTEVAGDETDAEDPCDPDADPENFVIDLWLLDAA